MILPSFRYSGIVLLALLSYTSLLPARPSRDWCGTYPGKVFEEIDAHRKSRAAGRFKSRALSGQAASRISGNILILDDADGVVARRTPFNLQGRSVRFTPGAIGYRFTTGTAAFDEAAANAGTPLAGLGDDDSREFSLPFSFPFFGNTYTRVWINADGNLTFGTADNLSAERSLGRLNFGPPRIAPLYTDLDPSVTANSVRVVANASRITVTWLNVQEFSEFGSGKPQSFQVILHSSGNIDFAWKEINVAAAVVGISPGALRPASALVSFSAGGDREYPAAVAERFGSSNEVDLVTASQKVFEGQEDAYDYLAFFNSSDIAAGLDVVAFQVTVRGRRKGIGDQPVDLGLEYGSQNRLQAVLNMGPLSQYPEDPNAPLPARAETGDTGLTVVAHEAGHLFLAFASVRENGEEPMLGRQGFHWAFTFNSEASLLEGNRIIDHGENANPRFRTIATVQGFAPLDQYLMGLRAPDQVPPTFYVNNSGFSKSLTAPRVGVTFGGTRRNVTVQEIIAEEGRRIPDHTVEQRRYRIGFVLVVPTGTEPKPADLAKLERYRDEFERAWSRYSENRSQMEATFKKNVRLSIEPAAGVLVNSTFNAQLSIDKPAASRLEFLLRGTEGLASVPSSVVLNPGERHVSFPVSGLRPGVETIRVEGPSEFMTLDARIQVTPANGAGLTLAVAGRTTTSVTFRVQDANELPYPGLSLRSGSTLITTDGSGQAIFPGSGSNPVRVTLEGTGLEASASPAAPPSVAAGGVVNAASFRPGLVSGGIATLFGNGLTNATVQIGNHQARVFYTSEHQINFAVPFGLSGTQVPITVRTSLGTVMVNVPLLPVQPGIFFDTASGRGAVIDRGGRVFEVYGTGFGGSGAISATVAGQPVEVLFSGEAPGFIGLQQVNIRVPMLLTAGEQPLVLAAEGVQSNSVRLLLQ